MFDKVVVKKLIRIFVIGLLLQANLLAADIYRSQNEQGQFSFSDKPSSNAVAIELKSQPYRYRHHVTKVYDGDTITLRNGEKVRLLGINTPEIKSHFKQAEAGGISAKKWLQDKIVNTDVLLEYDQQKRDKYNRLLAHIYLESGEHINLSMLAEGLATVAVIPPNLRYSEALLKAQAEAEQRNLGIWSMDEYQPIVIDSNNTHIPSGWHRFIVQCSAISYSRKYARLTINDHLDLRIAKTNLPLFTDIESFFGKKLEVRGWASRRGDHYSILVQHPSTIIPL